MSIRGVKTGSLAALMLVSMFLSGCGGSGQSNTTPSDPPPMSYTVGGTITGLQGTGLVMADDGASNLDVSPNSTEFTFATELGNATPYDITIVSQPSDPHQVCSVGNATGTVESSNVTNVAVTCASVSEELIISDRQVSGNSEALFVDPATGALSPTGIATGLTSSGQIATDPSGKFVYAANSTPAGISAYTVDPSTGALDQITGSPFSAPASPTGLTGLGIDPTGKFLYAGSASGAVAYTIDATSGALSLVPGSPFAAPMIGLTPGSVTCPCDAASGFLYYIQYLGASSFYVDDFSINTSTGALTSIGPAGPDTCCTTEITAATDPSAKIFFLAAETLQTYAISGTTGALTLLSYADPPTPPISWNGVAVDSSGKFAYAIAGLTLQGFSIDSTSGALTPLSPGSYTISGNGSPEIAFDSSGKYLYVAMQNPAQVWAYAFDSNTGNLTPVPGSPFSVTAMPNAMVFASLP